MLHSLTNGNNQGMPEALPSVSACGLSFAQNGASDSDDTSVNDDPTDVTNADNNDLFGTIAPLGVSVVTADCPVPTDLSIVKEADDDLVMPGDLLTYTVEVQNAGPAEARNVVVTDTLPAGVTFVSTSGCNNDPNGVPTCNLGSIAAGGSAQYSIATLVDAGTVGDITNLAEVDSDNGDPDRSNNSATADARVRTHKPPPPEPVPALGAPAVPLLAFLLGALGLFGLNRRKK